MRRGLLRYYACAAELSEVPAPPPPLRWVGAAPAEPPPRPPRPTARA